MNKKGLTSRNQQKIKNQLHYLGTQQDFYNTSYQLVPHHNKKWEEIGKNRGQNFQQVSDWHDKNYQLYACDSNSLPKLSYRNYSDKLRSRQSLSFSMDPKTYKSQLLNRSNKMTNQFKVSVNPVFIKFNQQTKKRQTKRAKLYFHKVLHMSEQQKDKKKLQQKQKISQNRYEQGCEDPEQLSPPKTERCSGILWMLKRRQQLRVYRKKKQNTDALKGIKFQY